ncbi:MAG: response regulator [Thermodesulfobacteriota bacterium]
MKKITVLVADDHAIVREGLRHLIARSEDLLLAGEAADGKEALARIRKLKPDVVLLDIAMPGLSGIECIPIIRQTSPRSAVVVLSMFHRETYVFQALAAGALGYVIKSAGWSEVMEAVRLAARKKHYLCREINAEILDRYLRSGEGLSSEAGRYDQLSSREQQVFRLVIEGNSTRDIAEMLCLSPKTVEKHRTNISRKLGMSDPLALLKFAIKIGVADPALWPDA